MESVSQQSELLEQQIKSVMTGVLARTYGGHKNIRKETKIKVSQNAVKNTQARVEAQGKETFEFEKRGNPGLDEETLVKELEEPLCKPEFSLSIP